jgi:hypothetical protein
MQSLFRTNDTTSTYRKTATIAKVTTSTKLRSNSIIEYDETTIGKPFKHNDPQWHTLRHVNTHIVDCLMNYEITNTNDERLWELFQEDFEDWDENLFIIDHKSICTIMRDFMRDNGINIGGARYILQQLTNIIKEN